MSVDNLLQATYKAGREIEEGLRKLMLDAFKTDIKLDYSQLSVLTFRIAPDLSKVSTDPMIARTEFENLPKLDSQGDGIKSFIATYLSAIVGHKPLLLIDEPEAFLHPPQAIKLGEVISNVSSKNQQVIVATHSTDILRGILNSRREDVSIVRIERTSHGSNVNSINFEDIKKITNDPLLSASRILDGLFYRGTILTESDSDATFYQRLARQTRNNDDVHYTHAHNKQTTHKASIPYKTLKIKHAIIVDFDILREQAEFKNLLKSTDINLSNMSRALEIQEVIKKEIESTSQSRQLENLMNQLSVLVEDIRKRTGKEDDGVLVLELRKKAEEYIESSKAWKEYKERGYDKLSTSSKKLFRELDSICSPLGIFIVPVGELESWLQPHGVAYSRNKGKWIVRALEAIPELNPSKEKLPWNFIERVHNYIMQ